MNAENADRAPRLTPALLALRAFFERAPRIEYADVACKTLAVTPHRAKVLGAVAVLLQSTNHGAVDLPPREADTEALDSIEKKGGVISQYGRHTALMTPLSRSGDAATTPRLVVGFDGEWGYQVRGGRRERFPLSVQFSMASGESRYDWLLFLDGRRFRFETVLSWLVMDLVDAGVLPREVYQPRPSKRASEKGKGKGRVEALSGKLRPAFVLELVGFYGVVDMSLFWRSAAEQFRKFDGVRGTLVSVQRPLAVSTSHPRDHDLVCRSTCVLRDAMLLAPEASNLAALGESLGLRKLELPTGYAKDDMGRLLNEMPDVFAAYALRDAVIARAWACMVRDALGLDRIPATLSGAGARFIRDEICRARGWSSDDFDMAYRGLVVERRQHTGDDGKVRSVRVLVARPEAALAHTVGRECYMGGRNECFLTGIQPGPWNDLDIASAYPTAMALLADPDYDSTPIVLRAGRLAPSHIPLPNVYLGARVRFVFPADTTFPCLPIRDSEGRGLIYALEGETWAYAPELYVALRMGCRIVVLQDAQGVASGAEFSMRGALRRLASLRAEAVENHGKKSPQALTFKGMSNGSYGKCAQGLAGARMYNLRADAMEAVPESTLTSPLQAALITSLVRALVSGCMEQIARAGGRVASVTTDGFLTTASAAEVEGHDGFGLAPYFRMARAELGGSGIWETKHQAAAMVMLTTRGGFGCGAIDGAALPHAGAGFKACREWKAQPDYAEKMARLYLERDGRMAFSYTKLPSLKEYVRDGADAVGETVRKEVSWEFDLKRSMIDPVMREIVIVGERFEHVSCDTRPWKTLEDFDRARRASAVFKGHAVKTVRDVEALRARVSMFGQARATGARLRGGTRQTLARSILRGLRGGVLMAPWYRPGVDGQRGRDVVRRLNDALGTSLCVSDWKNAGRRARQQRIVIDAGDPCVRGLMLARLTPVCDAPSHRPARTARTARTALDTTTLTSA